MISCEKDGPYIGFSHCPVCSAKYATEMGKTIRALETALAAMTAERDYQAKLADDRGDAMVALNDARVEAADAVLNLTAERDARDVAIGVLGEEVRVYRMHVGLCNAVNSRGWIVLSRLQRGTVASNLWSDAVRAVNANALARAAVEGER